MEWGGEGVGGKPHNDFSYRNRVYYMNKDDS